MQAVIIELCVRMCITRIHVSFLNDISSVCHFSYNEDGACRVKIKYQYSDRLLILLTICVSLPQFAYLINKHSAGIAHVNDHMLLESVLYTSELYFRLFN